MVCSDKDLNDPNVSIQHTYKILFVCSSLGGGGAERALLNIINYLNRSKFQPHLALLQMGGEFISNLLTDIHLYDLNSRKNGFIKRNFLRILDLKKLIVDLEPTLIVSINWQVNLITIIAKWLSNISSPLIIIEQIAPKESGQVDWKRRVFKLIERYLYPKADVIVTASSGIASELEKDYGIPEYKIHTIHNPVSIEEINIRALEKICFKSSTLPAIISVGRLVKQKNYRLLLESVFELLKTHPVELYILGQGPEESSIRFLASKLGINQHVHLLGFTSNPFAYMKQADIFAITSDFEGFGNVIVEAMVCGTPVVATDCNYGPREILEDGTFGVLIPVGNKIELVEAFKSLLDNPEKRKQFSELGKKRALVFSLDIIIQVYERLFIDLIENRNHN